MKKTFVCIAYKGDREHRHDDAVNVLKYELKIPVVSTEKCGYIGKARSTMATAVLQNQADVVFFIDSDTLFDPGDVEKLADVARETRGIVGAPYSQRMMGSPVVGSIDPSVGTVTFFKGGGLYPSNGVIGMGFTAIHREVFERLDTLPEMSLVHWSGGVCRRYFHEAVVDGFWMHEDASFCHLARSIGCRTDVDTRIRVLHLGEHPFSIEDCRRRAPLEESLTLKIRQ